MNPSYSTGLQGMNMQSTLQRRQMAARADPEDYPLFNLKGISFEDNLREMMFGFGDSIEPHPQTVELMDQLVKDFMTNLSLRCFDIAKRTHRNMDSEMIQYAVKSKEDYFYRLNELLKAFDEISKKMRYAANDEDRSAEARKRKKRTEKAAK
ncbi:hypothetical protein WA538_001827, partial [Blastocystis sp. DL]